MRRSWLVEGPKCGAGATAGIGGGRLSLQHRASKINKKVLLARLRSDSTTKLKVTQRMIKVKWALI